MSRRDEATDAPRVSYTELCSEDIRKFSTTQNFLPQTVKFLH